MAEDVARPEAGGVASSALDAARALAEAGAFAGAEAGLLAALGDDPAASDANQFLEHLRFMQGRVPAPADPLAALALAQRLAVQQGPTGRRGSDEGPRLETAAGLVL